ncbi:MAG: hypothetical protein KA248_10650 [Kiritimatiellae bacterium]|nr:hypothetical protein [Kiritimatiellia bacterium]
MSTEQLGLPGLQPDPFILVVILWNDLVFHTILPIRRRTHVIQAHPVPPEKQKEYNANGWPRHLIIVQEHRLRLVGHEHTLRVVTNAPEAEFQVPDRIITPVRGLGTFRDARLVWRTRDEIASVSVHATNPRHHQQALKLQEAKPSEHLERLAVAERTLQSGLLITGGDLPPQMTPDERVLANLLMSHKDPARGKVYSLAEIGRQLRCSDETIRRRKHALEAKYPELKRFFASVRTSHRKGVHPDSIVKPI